MTKPYVRLDKDNAAVLLVDHQTGLLSLVRDIDPDKFKNNVLALADIASYFKLPTILTTSFENGPNGPLVPELKSQFPQAPYIARPGNINADLLAAETSKAVRAPSSVERLHADAAEIIGDTPAQFAEFIAREQARWKQVIAKAQIKAD